MSIPSPTFYASTVQDWTPTATYVASTSIVVFNQMIFQCSANVGPVVPTANPSTDTSHWTFISNYFPNQLLGGDTFYSWRDAVNMAALAESNIDFRLTNLMASGLLGNRGAWTSATVYRKGDVVTQGVFGNLYVAVDNHLSSSLFSSDTAHWTLLLDLTGAYKKYAIYTAASVSLIAGNSYFLDSHSLSSGMICTLPATPSIGDTPINITHIDGDVTVSATAITITTAGHGNIMGSSLDLSIDKNFSSFSMVYSDASRGWRLTIL